MSAYVAFEDIQVHQRLFDVVNSEIIPGTGVSINQFWSATARLIRDYGPTNDALLKKRDRIQSQIDEYHLRNSFDKHDASEYFSFLSSIGYIIPPSSNEFTLETSNVDDEIARVPGPQLVVPVDNARYALNAANARWGSLLDAFYGTDAGPPQTNGATKRGPNGESYNEIRGKAVFEYAHKFLDTYFPLNGNNVSYNNVNKFSVNNNGQLVVSLTNGNDVRLVNEDKFVGYRGSINNLESILLRNNNLHVEILIDSNSRIGRTHLAGVKDILLESAITAIADFEDSVAAVDAFDKSNVYSNWNGLMKGTLTSTFSKGKNKVNRTLNSDKEFIRPGDNSNNNKFIIGGRALLLVRNVGIHMYNDMILNKNNQETPEGLIDLMVTCLASLHDLNKSEDNRIKNSRAGSVYIVKPKLHGPEEVAFTLQTFDFAEKVFGLTPNTLKIGIMDEERRTTVNLYECIRLARKRLIFINTGFLDRTGDEIHTSFYAGAVLPKSDIKKEKWRTAYERYNVEVGLKVGLLNNGQIGKGMWAAPNAMADMLATKSNHPKAGATCAWVPSPTAGTLHSIHYHETNVLNVQKNILNKNGGTISMDSLNNLLRNILIPPINKYKMNELKNEDIIAELENNIQGILGYVVRWIELGVGCSTVPDNNNVGLMEDRATLRISSQHVANWLYHGIVTKERVLDVFKRMSKVVDRQNELKTVGYRPMYGNFTTNNAFKCAVELVLNGKESNNGLTETILTKYRKLEKQKLTLSKL